MKLTATAKGVTRLQEALNASRKNEKKALDTAIKVEGFRLRKVLMKEIRQGAPGGQPLAPVSAITRRLNRSAKPLRSMAKGIRYHIQRDPFAINFGFVGNRSWRSLAEKMQAGATIPVSDSLRAFLARTGGTMGKRARNRKYFFLKKSTTSFTTPARPIIDPFWATHKIAAEKNIVRNWKRKIRGERI